MSIAFLISTQGLLQYSKLGPGESSTFDHLGCNQIDIDDYQVICTFYDFCYKLSLFGN